MVVEVASDGGCDLPLPPSGLLREVLGSSVPASRNSRAGLGSLVPAQRALRIRPRESG